MVNKTIESRLRQGIREWNEWRQQNPHITIDLSGADLHGAVLRGAILHGAILDGANLSGANLRDAILIDANLSGANLSGAILNGALLDGTNLSGANLHDAILDGTNLDGTILQGTKHFTKERNSPTIKLAAPQDLVFDSEALIGSLSELLPDRIGPALVVRIEGTRIVRKPHSPPERNELQSLYKKVLREAQRLRERGALHNFSPDIAVAINDYMEQLPQTYEALDEVELGVEGQLLSKKFDGAKARLVEEFPEEEAMVQALLLAHELLVARLPHWQTFLNEGKELKGVPQETEDEIGDAVREISAQWYLLPSELMEKSIPEAIQHFLALAGKSANVTVYAAARAIYDVIESVFRHISGLGSAVLAETKSTVGKTFGLFFATIALTGPISAFVAHLPWFSSWFERGIQLLKAYGLF